MPSAPGARRRAVRLRWWSGRVSRRTTVLTVVAAALVLALAVSAMMLGDYPLSPTEVLVTVAGGGSDQEAFIVRTLRLPRVLVGAGVGVALAVSGSIFQGLVRNPLVAPDVIGVMAGATVAAVTAIVVFQSTAIVPVAAFVGAVLATFVIYGLTWRQGVAGGRLVLVGVGLEFVLTALTTLVIVRFPVEQVTPAIVWMTGTLYGAAWSDVVWLAGALAVLLPAALALMPRLQRLQLGDELATALGVALEPSRAGLLAVGAGLAATAVAVAGPVKFVALMIPHVARLLAGPLTGGVLVLAGMLGAVLVVGSDLVAQHAFSPTSLPAGIVTAAIGAPYFLFLLHRVNRHA
jgi:iron complex transport system permease protein